MSFSLRLPHPWGSQGWKVKIRDRERLEPPHVTLMHGTRSWRWSLRSQVFLDQQPDPKGVPNAILTSVRESLDFLRRAWDRMYPENPVDSQSGTTSSSELQGKSQRKHK